MTEKTEDTSTLNLYQKLARISGEVGAIKKGGQNREQNYAFIEYAAVAGELRSLFAKYGIVIIPYMQRSMQQTRTPIKSKYDKEGEHVLIDFTFVVRNADNPEEKFSVTWTGEATDFGDKATNKAATSALKYYLMRQFNISEQGDDPDADSPEGMRTDKTPTPKEDTPKRASREQIGQMLTAIRELTGLEDKAAVIAAFVKLIKVEPTQVPASKVDSILQRIEDAKTAKANAELEAEATAAQETAAAGTEDAPLPVAQAEEPTEYINGGQQSALKILAKKLTGLEATPDLLKYIHEVAGTTIDKIPKADFEGLKTRMRHRALVADKGEDGVVAA